MSRVLLHQFSPQRTDPESLEAILVGREEVVRRTVAKVRDSALTANKHHSLFIGPRGIGKTHLLSLIHHRIQRDSELASRLRIAWLNEDEISSSFLRLLVRINRELSSRYPEEFPATDIRAITGIDPADALKQLTKSFLHRVGDHTVVILIENLDAHFAKIPLAELRRWRAFVQDHPVFVTLGTAQRLFDGVSKRDEPFFGFFDTRHLKPLTLAQTQQMLIKVAKLNGREEDKAFIRFLETDRGQARLKAMHFLAGGNPRLYVLLSELITRDELDDVVRTFEEVVDRQLTSYYQERLRWLSTLQQEIVQVLCRRRHPVSVKEIAADLFTTNQSVSSQLRELKGFGYVRSHQVGRESLYELTEPLMRLVLEVKESHVRQPLTLIVAFLRVWFDREELDCRLRQPAGCSGVGAKYVQAAIRHYDRGEDLRRELLEFEQAKDGTVDMSEAAIASCDNRMDLAHSQFTQGKYEEAIKLLTEIVDEHDSPAVVASALFNRGVAFGKCGDIEAELGDYSRVIDLPHAPVEYIADALLNRGVIFGQSGDAVAAISDYTQLIEFPNVPADLVARALINRGVAFGQNGDTDAELSDYTRLIELRNAPIEQVVRALLFRGITFGQIGDSDAEISDYAQLIELPNAPADQVADALLFRGVAFGQIGDRDAELSDYSRLITLPGAPIVQVAIALLSRGVAFWQNGDTNAALSDLAEVIGSPNAPVDQIVTALSYRGYISSQTGHFDAALADYEEAEQLSSSSDDDIRFTFSVIKAGLYLRLGRIEEAVSLVSDVLNLPADKLSHVIEVDSTGFWLDLIRVAFAAGPSGWQTVISSMVRRAEDTNSLPELGESLVRHLKDIKSCEAEEHTFEAWKSTFTAAGDQCDSLIIPLRLLGVGVNCIEARSEDALLSLPLEERRILRQALELDKEDAQS